MALGAYSHSWIRIALPLRLDVAFNNHLVLRKRWNEVPEMLMLSGLGQATVLATVTPCFLGIRLGQIDIFLAMMRT